MWKKSVFLSISDFMISDHFPYFSKTTPLTHLFPHTLNQTDTDLPPVFLITPIHKKLLGHWFSHPHGFFFLFATWSCCAAFLFPSSQIFCFCSFNLSDGLIIGRGYLTFLSGSIQLYIDAAINFLKFPSSNSSAVLLIPSKTCIFITVCAYHFLCEN